jgi:hypothetical protein
VCVCVCVEGEGGVGGWVGREGGVNVCVDGWGDGWMDGWMDEKGPRWNVFLSSFLLPILGC